SSAQRDTGEEPGASPKDRHLRPILRKESEPFVGRSYPADADEYNTLPACAYKSVSQNWGVARSVLPLDGAADMMIRIIQMGKIPIHR
ncbi:MAG TPA: hypothetical protein VEH09_08905, partial [Thermodesulfobacteriota bacterium]|nr:hypothetical protein [Thermodesulfobacteriota bacterium]